MLQILRTSVQRVKHFFAVMDGRMHGETDRLKGRQTDGQTDGHIKDGVTEGRANKGRKIECRRPEVEKI